jgi:hypothetical protein
MLGAIADHLPFPADVLLACILKRFARKGEKVVEANRRPSPPAARPWRSNSPHHPRVKSGQVPMTARIIDGNALS